MRRRQLRGIGSIPQSLHSARALTATRTAFIGLALAVPITVAACGGGSSSSSSAGSSPSTAASSPSASSAGSASASASGGAEPTAGAGAISAIKANWAIFFDASTPLARRVALLQNGQVLSQAIQAQAGNPLAAAASAKVTSVTLTSSSQADVVYDIVISGTPMLTGQKGVAVYEGGVWKVGDASFCGLLKLQNGGKTTGLPASCQG